MGRPSGRRSRSKPGTPGVSSFGSAGGGEASTASPPETSAPHSISVGSLEGSPQPSSSRSFGQDAGKNVHHPGQGIEECRPPSPDSSSDAHFLLGSRCPLCHTIQNHPDFPKLGQNVGGSRRRVRLGVRKVRIRNRPIGANRDDRGEANSADPRQVKVTNLPLDANGRGPGLGERGDGLVKLANGVLDTLAHANLEPSSSASFAQRKVAQSVRPGRLFCCLVPIHYRHKRASVRVGIRVQNRVTGHPKLSNPTGGLYARRLVVEVHEKGTSPEYFYPLSPSETLPHFITNRYGSVA